jgi:hypothetical protein
VDGSKMGNHGRPCVITLGIKSAGYRGHPEVIWQDFGRGIRRLRSSLVINGFDGDFLTWETSYPRASPPHEVSPFAFKPFCFHEAYERGYRKILWADSSIVVKRPLPPLFDRLVADGYLLFNGTHSVGAYCTDHALETLEITRSEAFEIPCCRGSVLGLNLSDSIAVAFLRRWTQLALDGVSFPGPKWSGVGGWPRTASQDPRVRGHRHDQTAASVLAQALKMTRWQSIELFDEYFEIDRRFVRLSKERFGGSDATEC